MIIYNVPQGSEAWHTLRLGKPTASNFSSILTPIKAELSKQADGLAYKLAAERISGYSLDGVSTAAMEAGRAGESQARAWFEMARGCEVQEVGICFTDDGRVGASPDGLVGERGLLEIKVPTAPIHVGYLLSGFGVETDYRCQVQGQLWVCEREELETVSYCPPFVHATRKVYRDQPFIGKLSAAVLQFADKVDEAEQKLLSLGCIAVEPRPLRPAEGGADWLGSLGVNDADVDAIYAGRPNA